MKMLCSVYLGLIIFLNIELVWSIVIQLNGPSYARRHHIVLLNCSTDTPPIGLAAELQVNSKSFVDVRYYNMQCFSTKFGNCPPEECKCSSEGKWFSHTYRVNQKANSINFTCAMRYGTRGTYSKSISVNIIDIVNPIIKVYSELPLYVGEEAEIGCFLESDLKNISLSWICDGDVLVNTELKQYNNTIKMSSVQVQMSHDDKNCTCLVKSYGLKVQSSVLLPVTNQTKDELAKTLKCNASKPVTLFCMEVSVGNSNLIPSTSQPLNGFCLWEHSFRGTFIRKLREQLNDNSSELTIESCSIEDTGNYTCHYCIVNATSISVNKTTTIVVKGSPTIVHTIIKREETIMISVFVRSESEIRNVKWSFNNRPIINSTSTVTSFIKGRIRSNVYDTIVNIQGFVANLTANLSAVGNFTIMLKNEFGTTRRSFIITSDSVIIDLRIFIFAIIAFGIFIVTTTCTTIVTKARQFRHQVHIIGPFEHSPAISVYHSAPQTTPTVHLYDEVNHPYLDVIDLESEEYYLDTTYKDTSSEDASNDIPGSSSCYEEIE